MTQYYVERQRFKNNCCTIVERILDILGVYILEIMKVCSYFQDIQYLIALPLESTSGQPKSSVGKKAFQCRNSSLSSYLAPLNRD